MTGNDHDGVNGERVGYTGLAPNVFSRASAVSIDKISVADPVRRFEGTRACLAQAQASGHELQVNP